MEEKQNAALGTAPLGKLMVKFALPCTISLLVGALYNIVDQIFIGWGVGYLGNGATNVVFPLTVLAPGSGCDDRRRRVQLRVDLLREKQAGRCGLRRWQHCDAERVGWRARGGILRGVPDADFAAVRRDGGKSRLCEGILHLHHHRHSDLRLRAGDQPDHPLGRRPRFAMASMLAGAIANWHPRPPSPSSCCAGA